MNSTTLSPEELLQQQLLDKLKPGPCVQPWIAAFDALDPATIRRGFDVTRDEFDAVQAACPWDRMSDRDKSHVFGGIEEAVRSALAEAGYIQFQLSSSTING